MSGAIPAPPPSVPIPCESKTEHVQLKPGIYQVTAFGAGGGGGGPGVRSTVDPSAVLAPSIRVFKVKNDGALIEIVSGTECGVAGR